ncbi:MAG: two-component system cell cycle sensor histidine kinase/response regulator CckA [Desulforhopalus sp.]|jgi:two-component system cell cycle sensor histidine kinase/response regulator CckA
MNRNWIIRTLFLCLFIPLFLVPGRASSRPNVPLKNILVLHSYHKGLGWTDSITRGIESTLAKGSISYELFYEFLDSKRVTDDQHIKNLVQLLKHKYAGLHFDAIILSDDFAFSFMLQYHDELFTGTPVVFCGVNYFRDSMIENRPYITGVVESYSLKGTVDGALLINPAIKTVYAIDDDTITGKANKKLLDELIPEYRGRLEITYSGQQTMAEIQKACASLPLNTMVLLMSFTQDSAGEIFSLERSADLTSQYCTSPVYSFWDFHLHHGVIGGKLTTGLSHGEKAAELVLRILAGESVTSIPVVKESPNRYIFDYTVLQRFGIPLTRLPADSTVINQPPSFYTQYKSIFWQVLVLIALLMTVICVISFNLIKRRSAETALKRSEERLRAIFQAAETVSFIITDATDPVPLILEFSPGSEKIFGFRRDEIIGTPVSVIHLPEDIETFPAAHRQMRDGHQGFSGEVTLIRKTGEQFPALFSTHPLLDEQGRMWAALGVSIDISAQKHTEMALRQSTERFQELSELLPETIYELDFSGTVLFINKSGMEQFGFTPDDLVQGINAFDYFVTEEKDKLRQNMERLLRGEHVGLNEYNVHDKTGKVFPVITRSALIYHESKPVGIRGFLIDISDRKRLEENFHNAQKMESIGTLAGGIAHDFNNLLMGIQGHTSLLLQDLAEGNPLRKQLLSIEDYVKSASSLTAQLLGFARSGKYQLKATDINEMISKTSEMFGRTKKELTIVLSLQEDLLAATVDRNQIEQVLLNLYVNAWQAMPDGGRLDISTCNSTVSAEEAPALSLPPGRYIQLTATDNGTGIDEEIRPKIFEPFVTTKARGRGTGLGLASAYGIIRNHQGTIAVRSKKGEGSSFSIYLPATDNQPEKETLVTESPLMGKGTILLVDDEPMIIDVGSAMLTHLGYIVHTAGSGREAIDFYSARTTEIDLIILDMIMPELSGEETFSRLLIINPAVRVLLSSGYSLDGQAENILAAGCCGFIQKPFNINQFSQKIRTILDEPQRL